MRLFLTILFIFVSSTSLFAQDEWIRVQSENSEISFSIPKDYYYFFDKKGFNQNNPKDYRDQINYSNLHSVTAFEKGVTMFFESYESRASKKGITYFLGNFRDGKYAKIDFEKFTGLYVLDEKDAFKTYYYFASEKHTYLIGFASREKTNATIERFLASIKLGGKNAFSSTANFPEINEFVSFSQLEETKVETEKTEKEDNKKTSQKKESSTNVINIKPDDLNTIVPNNVPTNQFSSPLLVFFKPRAQYTDSARQSGEQGDVQLRVTFLANGHIGKITVVKTLGGGLVENAIRAVKRVKFLPPERTSIPATVTKTIVYNFALY